MKASPQKGKQYFCVSSCLKKMTQKYFLRPFCVHYLRNAFFFQSPPNALSPLFPSIWELNISLQLQLLPVKPMNQPQLRAALYYHCTLHGPWKTSDIAKALRSAAALGKSWRATGLLEPKHSEEIWIFGMRERKFMISVGWEPDPKVSTGEERRAATHGPKLKRKVRDGRINYRTIKVGKEH